MDSDRGNFRSSLQELLKQSQHPFHLQSYIAEKRSHLKSKPLQTSFPTKTLANPRINPPHKHARFSFSLHASPGDVRKSPSFLGFPSPLKSPRSGGPVAAAFIHIPTRTAALLLESAMRIQKQRQPSKPKTVLFKSHGVGRLFGSFLRRLRRSSKSNRKRAIGIKGIGEEDDESGSFSCSCSVGGGADRSLASTSVYPCKFSDRKIAEETQLRTSPFRFVLLGSPSSSASGTPDFSSPAASPRLLSKEEIEERNPENVRAVKEEDGEKQEQSSPVSILDDPFAEDERESEDEDEHDHDTECSSYDNVERKKQQLLHRLRRFEKLAELDPVELEKKMIECSDKELDEEPLSLDDDALLLEVLAYLNYYEDQSEKVSTDMKKLLTDLIVEEKGEALLSSSKDFILARICNRLDSWKEVEFHTIDAMVDVDFKNDFDMWKGFAKPMDEAMAEIELEILEVLVEELVVITQHENRADMISV